MKGFFKRMLIIDLTKRSTRVETIDDELCERYMGGKGLASHLLYEMNPAGVDPFSPDNHFIIGLGPSTDSAIYGSCRYGIFSKSPLTGFYAESYSGGKIAIAMSRTGYDFMVLKGASETPVWLEISDNEVTIHDAADIWGKETYESEDEISRRVDVKGSGTMVIGPSGENLIRFAVVENDYWRSAGRTGMGAVLGSKKVKGIAFHGNTRREFAEPEKIKAYSKKMLSELKDHAATQTYRNQGTPVMVGVLNNAGAFPTKYWSEGKADHWEKINAQSMAEKCDVRPRSCRTCFMACGKHVEIKDGRHKGLKLEGPEYETLYSFGGLCLLDSIEEIVHMNDLCDRLGMDTMSAGNMVAFAIEASKRGRISDQLDYGNPDTVADLLHKISRREEIGGLLAEGIRAAATELGLEDIAVHVKGLEPAGYDPRVLKGMGLAYAVSPRGACHLRSTFYKAELAGMIPKEQVDGKAEFYMDFEDRCTLFDTMILCRFYRDFYPWEELSKLFEMTTGKKHSKEELKALASRVTDITRKFNIREGLTPDDDRLPQRFVKEPLPDGSLVDENELKKMVSDYYQLRGWSKEGVPAEAALA